MCICQQQSGAGMRSRTAAQGQDQGSVPVQSRNHLPTVLAPERCGAHPSLLLVHQSLIAGLLHEGEILFPRKVRNLLKAHEVCSRFQQLIFHHCLPRRPLRHFAISGIPVVLVDPPAVLVVRQQDVVRNAREHLVAAGQGRGSWKAHWFVRSSVHKRRSRCRSRNLRNLRNVLRGCGLHCLRCCNRAGNQHSGGSRHGMYRRGRRNRGETRGDCPL
mmetsp:Transcript_30571/g.87737  ORF Transcript_30571/g.87737 Transcript_30571/m.87737 type:complete len:216 (-) Transcript_30571:171-818(-)